MPAQIWDTWIPGAGSQGAPFARGRMDAAEVVLVHAAPDRISVEVRGEDGAVIASGSDLQRTADTPIARLTVDGDRVTREDVWPDANDTGRPVLLMGGEIGILQRWWHAPDHSEWRWSLEFYNHR